MESSPTSMPLVTAVVVNFNGTDLTCDCVDSLLSSSYPNLEIAIVDNASADQPAALFREKYPDCQVIESSENRGYTGGVNLGLEHAFEGGSKFALVLNNDTICEPDMVEVLVRAAIRNPKAGMLSPRILYHEPRDLVWYAGGAYSLFFGVSRHWRLRKRDRPDTRGQREVSFISGCAFLIRREVPDQLGLLDEKLFHIAEDADLSIRASRAGYRLLYIPEARLYHRESVATLKHFGSRVQIYLATRNILYLQRKHGRWYHHLIFYPWFSARWLVYQSLKHLFRGEPVMVGALFEAVVSSLRGETGPPLDFIKRHSPDN